MSAHKYRRMSARAMGLVRCGRQGGAGGGGGGGQNEPVSRNLSRKNAKLKPPAKIVASRKLSRNLC